MSLSPIPSTNATSDEKHASNRVGRTGCGAAGAARPRQWVRRPGRFGRQAARFGATAALLFGLTLVPTAATAAPDFDEVKLTASDAVGGDFFGSSVAVSGDTIVVGASRDDDNGPNSGSAYVYQPNGTGGYTQTKLTASDADPGDEFGDSVAVSGNTIVVGASRDKDNGGDSGSAYVYQPDGTGGYTETKLIASDGTRFDSFGVSVAVSGDTIVVGAKFGDDDGSESGSAYVFQPDGTGGYTETELTASDAARGDFFGFSVAVSGDTIVVGARDDDDNGRTSGSTYVYQPDGTGGYTETKLTASDAAGGGFFGFSVAVSGDTIIVGAIGDGDNGTSSGSLYVYQPDDTGGYTETKLTASDGTRFDSFGFSVAVSGDTIVVGAIGDGDNGDGNNGFTSGSAYVYQPDGTGGYTETKFTASDGAESDRFGISVAVSGDTIVVGAEGDDDNGSFSGSAYVFGPTSDAERPDTGIATVAPARVLDTRVGFDTVDGLFAGVGRLQAGEVTEVQVAGRDRVPEDATAGVLNLTATRTAGRGYASVFPCGAEVPAVSTVNFEARDRIANSSIVALSASGSVCVFSSVEADYAIDVTGFVLPGSSVTTQAPTRLLDTRQVGATVDGLFVGRGGASAGETIEVQIAGRGAVPAGSAAAMLNVTAVNPTATGFVTVFPCGGPPPLASLLNPAPGRSVANASLVPLSGSGAVCVFTSVQTELLIDASGSVPETSVLKPVVPARLLDTRAGEPTVDAMFSGTGAVDGGEVISVQVAGRGGVPSDARTAVLNLTAVGGAERGYATVFPCTGEVPLASTLNYVRDQVIANATVVGLSPDGDVCVFVNGTVDLVIDVTGHQRSQSQVNPRSTG